MNTRRKFIINGSLTAAALVALKPFKALAGSSGFTQTNTAKNYIVLMHTASLEQAKHQQTLGFIRSIQNKTNKTLTINAADNATDLSMQFDTTASVETSAYQIIRKGGVSTGIIYANTAETGLAYKLSKLALTLKNEKDCQVVVCMSQLGYNQKDKLDDRQLAAMSTDIDIIIGSNTQNFAKHTMVLHNSNRQEVILQSANATAAAFGKIEIGFNDDGFKNHIHVLSTVPQKHQRQQNGCIVAA